MKLFFIAFAFVSSFTAQAINIKPCYNTQDRVTEQYQNCVNKNFQKIDDELKTFLLECRNTSVTHVEYGYTNCIESNFNHASRELGFFPQRCYNSSSQYLDSNYQSCVNFNFSRAEWYINRLTK